MNLFESNASYIIKLSLHATKNLTTLVFVFPNHFAKLFIKYVKNNGISPMRPLVSEGFCIPE